LTFGPVDTLILGDLFEIFDRFVHEITNIVDLSKNLCVSIPFNELLKLTINHSDALDVTGIVIDLLKF
jgi:hypothetical protein